MRNIKLGSDPKWTHGMSPKMWFKICLKDILDFNHQALLPIFIKLTDFKVDRVCFFFFFFPVGLNYTNTRPWRKKHKRNWPEKSVKGHKLDQKPNKKVLGAACGRPCFLLHVVLWVLHRVGKIPIQTWINCLKRDFFWIYLHIEESVYIYSYVGSLFPTCFYLLFGQ